MGEASRLRGRALEAIEQAGARVVVRAGGEAVVFSAREGEDDAVELRADLGAAAGGRMLYADLAKTTIVRVKEASDRVTLHFGDGEILHLEAVRNEHAEAVVATRTAREHGRGASALLDRLLGKLSG